MIALLALLMGLAAGELAGGRILRLSRLRLKYEVALVGGFVLQGVARGRIVGTLPTSWGLVVWAGVSIALVVLLALNRRTPGTVLAAAGVLLNLDVVVANGAMPVAAVFNAASARAVGSNSAGFYQVSGMQTAFAWLGDALPLNAVGQRFLLSPGDVVLGVGVAIIIARTLLSEPESVADDLAAGAVP
jgi:hypothetical protein